MVVILKNASRPGPFFEEIKDVLESFVQKSNLEYLRWYHDIPLFIFGSGSIDERRKMDRPHYNI